MITRIVKLTIQPEKTDEFKDFFKAKKKDIENYEGCAMVTLYQDIKYPNIFFTYSHWENEDHLNNYRKSDLFSNIWNHAKSCFCDRPNAWSLIEI